MVIGTEGRAFWIFDDLPLLYQIMAGGAPTEDAKLYQPKNPYRFGGGGRGGRSTAPVGENPAGGATVYYWLKNRPQGEVTLEFLDAAGKSVNKFSTREEPRPQAGPEDEEGPRLPPPARLTAQAGLNRFVWNLRYPDASSFPGMILWAGTTIGPRASPGKYSVKLTVDGKAQTESFEVMKDPRLETSADDYAKQLSLSIQLRDKLTAANDAVVRIRELRAQLEPYTKRDAKKIADAAKVLIEKMTAVEEALYQTKNRASEDPLNYPIKLNNKIAHVLIVVQSSDNQPTQQSYMVYEELATQVNAEFEKARRAHGGRVDGVQ